MIKLLELLNILSSRYMILFNGEWGSGKSLSMVGYANLMLQFKDIRNVLSKMPVYFYDIDDVSYTPLVQTSQLEDIGEDTIILHDELLDDIDRRNSLSPVNKYLTKFAKAYRKLNVQEVGTVQYIEDIDERLIRLMQILITPKFKKKYHKKVAEDIKIRMTKKQYGSNGDWRMKWHIMDFKEDRSYTTEINLGRFIEMYDTKYIPNKLAVTHKDYLDWFMIAQSKPKNELLTRMNEEIIHKSKLEWKEGMKQLIGDNSEYSFIKEVCKI